MLSEFIEKIGEMAVAATAAQVIRLPDDPPHVSYIYSPDKGTLGRVEATPAPRRHTVGTLDEIARAVEMWGDLDERPWSCWYDRNGVQLLIDDTTRRDGVTMMFTVTPQFAELQAMEGKSVPFTQVELIWKMRTSWANILSGANEEIRKFRGLNWVYLKEETASIEPGKTSIGKKVKAEVSGQSALPDFLNLNVPVFVQRLDLVPAYISVILEPDPSKERFLLSVTPGNCELAMQAAEKRVGEKMLELLPDHGQRLFLGTP